MNAAARVAEGVPAGFKPAFSCQVPGRLEFLGKHTDYAGGRSLVAALDRGIAFAAAPRSDRILRITDLDRHQSVEIVAGETRAGSPSWAGYFQVVLDRMARDLGMDAPGTDLFFASDLPSAAGLSSSSALVTGCLLSLGAIAGIEKLPFARQHFSSREKLAEYLGAAESGRGFGPLEGGGGVGTRGGCQDHAAMLLSQAGALVQLGFLPLQVEETIALPGLVFVVAASGIAAEKTGAAMARYNRLADLTEAIRLKVEGIGGPRRSLVAALEDPVTRKRLRATLMTDTDPGFDRGALVARLEQVILESTVIIPDAVDALRRGDLAELGRQVDLSMLFAERMLGNQVPETVALAGLARDLGAVAASAFGAGFGGSVYALVPESGADGFLDRWRERYLARFPARSQAARFFVSLPGPAVTLPPGGWPGP